MNIYDTKVIVCSKCKKGIGEIEIDSALLNPICGVCLSHSKDVKEIIDAKSHHPVSIFDIVAIA